MKKLSVILTAFFLWISVLSPSQPIDFPANKAGKLKTCKGYTVKFKRLVVEGDSVICKTKNIKLTYAATDICRIDKRGNQIALYLPIFAGAGLIYGLIDTATWDEELMGPKSTPILLSTGIFSVAGLILGACLPKYKTVYRKDRVGFKISPQVFSYNDRVTAGIRLGLTLK